MDETKHLTTEVISEAVGDALPAASEAFRPRMSVAEIHHTAALCEIARMPEALIGIMKRNLSFDQARSEIADRRIAEAGPEIQSTITGEAGTNPSGEGADRLLRAVGRLVKAK